MPLATTNSASCSNSSRVPIVEPMTWSCLKKILVSSAFAGASPLVAPQMTIRPPGRSELTEWDQVAAPTVSMTASTRSGSRAPDSKAWAAPRARAASPLAASRLVTHIRNPAALPNCTSAVATPPDAPWTSTVSPSEIPPLVKSIRYAVSQAVGRQAACSHERPVGFGTTLRAGTRTCSAKVPGWSSERSERLGSRVSSPTQPGVAMTAWTSTSLPWSSVPAASQPRIIGSRSAGSPTPRRDQTSW